jgi:hypothetical protein
MYKQDIATLQQALKKLFNIQFDKAEGHYDS